MARSYELRLSDMLQAMEQVRAVVTRVRDFRLYEEDRDSQMIVERGLEIVSEASRHLPAELKQRHSGIPWDDIQGIGNKLRHEYHRIVQPVLWNTACFRLPELMEIYKAELERERDPG